MKSTQGNIPLWFVPALTAVIAVAFGLFTYRLGRIESPDTVTYSAWADILISSNFSYLQLAQSISFVVPSPLYFGWITVVALFKIALGPSWSVGIVIFNYCLTLLAVWGTLEFVKRVSQSVASILVAGALLLIGYEIFNWIRYVLSDTSFMALAFGVYCLFCILAISTEKGGSLALRCSLCIALIILALFYRPTGAPLVLAGGLTYLTKRVVKNKYGHERALLARRLAAGLCLIGIAAIVAHAYFMKDPSTWPLSFASKWVQRLSEEYHQGYIVFQRPETYVATPTSLLDYVLMTCKKFLYFFSVFARSFSFTHKLANLAFFAPVYPLALLAAFSLFRRNSNLAEKEWWAGWIAVLWIPSFALFHGLQQIDYDWRYRLPCMLPLIILSTIGFRVVTLRHRA